MRSLRLFVFLLMIAFLTTGQYGQFERPHGQIKRPNSGLVEIFQCRESWSPVEMSNIVHWWRADSLVTETSAGSDSVIACTDIIGGEVLSATLGDTTYPAYVHGANGIGGQDALEGDGVDDYLYCDIDNIVSPWSIWIVCTVPADNDATNVVFSVYSTSRGIFANYGGAYHRWEIKTGVLLCIQNLPAAGTEGLAFLDQSSDDFYWNGTKQTNYQTGGDAAIFYVRLFSSTKTQPASIKIAELGIHNGAISEADRLALEGYVKSRYGLSW